VSVEQKKPRPPIVRIIVTSLVVAALWTLLFDRDNLGLNNLYRFGWRALAAVAGAAVGWLLNGILAPYFNVGLGTVRSTGYQFSDGLESKVLNSFIFMFAIAGIIVGGFLIK